MSRSLTEIYDADMHHYDDECRDLRAKYPIPHPLHGVQYADGERRDTTAGKVHTPKPPFGGYKR